jgi:hypothetical protein
MDWEAEVVSRLSLWQIGNGLKWFVQEEPEPKEPRPRADTRTASGTTPAEPFVPHFPFRLDANRVQSLRV